jgi:hypothetical protein
MRADQALSAELAGCRNAGRDEGRSRHDASSLCRPLPTSRRATVRIALVGERRGAEGLNSVASAAAMAVEFLGVSDVAPMRYGTFPVLASTPDQLRTALADRGLGHVGVHATTPGSALG